MSGCRSCGAEITWAKTLTGKRMPIDAEPDNAKGNLLLIKSNGVGVLLPLAGLNDEARQAAERQRVPLYVSHFATCPQAGDWRGQ